MKAKVLKYKFDGNTVVAPYMELEAYAEKHLSRYRTRTNTGMKTMIISMWSARLKTSISLAGSIPGNAWKGGTKKNLSSIAKTGLRICFRMRKTGNHVSLFVDPCF